MRAKGEWNSTGRAIGAVTSTFFGCTACDSPWRCMAFFGRGEYMDTKGSRQSEIERRVRRQKNVKTYGNDQAQRSFTKYAKFLKTHKQSLLTSVLHTFLVVLLFALFSQLQAPATSSPPSGVTAVDYST